MQDSFPVQAVFKCLARILASKVTMKDEPLCIPDIQARIFYRFHRQFRRHGCSIGIPYNFSAAQIHNRSQIGPSFFLYMDVSDIRTPFLVDRVRPKITSQNIFLIIRNAAMVGMMIVFLYYDGAQPLLRHMSLHPLNTAGCTVIIQCVAYFDGSIPLF